MNHPKVSVNVLVLKDDKLLLGLRRHTTGDGFWGLPGGHLEFMESAVECGKREVWEETGLTIKYFSSVRLINEPCKEDGTHYVHFDFVAKDFDGEPELREPEKCERWEWFVINKLPSNIFLGHRKSIQLIALKSQILDYSLEGNEPNAF